VKNVLVTLSINLSTGKIVVFPKPLQLYSYFLTCPGFQGSQEVSDNSNYKVSLFDHPIFLQEDFLTFTAAMAVELGRKDVRTSAWPTYDCCRLAKQQRFMERYRILTREERRMWSKRSRRGFILEVDQAILSKICERRLPGNDLHGFDTRICKPFPIGRSSSKKKTEVRSFHLTSPHLFTSLGRLDRNEVAIIAIKCKGKRSSTPVPDTDHVAH